LSLPKPLAGNGRTVLIDSFGFHRYKIAPGNIVKKQDEVKHTQIVHLRKQEISTEIHTYLKQEFSVKLNRPLNPGTSFH